MKTRRLRTRAFAFALASLQAWLLAVTTIADARTHVPTEPSLPDHIEAAGTEHDQGPHPWQCAICHFSGSRWAGDDRAQPDLAFWRRAEGAFRAPPDPSLPPRFTPDAARAPPLS